MAFMKRKRAAAPFRRRVRRRMALRKPRIGRMPMLTMKRTFWLENWTPNTTTTAGFWRFYDFAFDQLPSYTEISNLFDVYKINGIKITLRPRYTEFAGNDTTDTTIPGITTQGTTMVHVIKDQLNNSVVPSGVYSVGNLNNFLENGNVRSYQGTKPINIYFKPMILNTVVNGGSMNKVGPRWLQTVANGMIVRHTGAHIFLQDVNLTGTFNQSFDVFVTYYFQAKGLK